jgi:hypothetical protein
MRVNDMQRMSVRRNGLHVRSALPLPLTPPALDGLSALSVRQSHSTTSKLSVNAARILSERATTTTPSKASCKRAGIDRDARIVPKSPQPPPRQLNSCTLLVEYLKREQIAHERVQRRHLAEVERLLKRNPPIVRTTDKHYLCRQVKDLQRFVAQQRQGRRRRHSPTGSDTHQLDDGRRTAATLPLARPWSNLAVSTMQVISECLMWLRGITRQRPKR